jgi:hypothetical protein
MCSHSPAAACCQHRTAASASRFAELVKKTGTSATLSTKNRRTRARKKVLQAITEQRRFAKKAKRRAVALTLTFASDASFSSRHISDFLAAVRQALKRRGCTLPYAWVLERGSRLHYHLILWLPRDFDISKDKLEKWWSQGATHIQSCRCVKAWARYIAKFNCMTVIPKAARLFGYGGLDETGKTAVQRAGLPRWLQTVLPIGTCVRRLSGGGWANAETGEVHRSPYRWTPRGCVLRDATETG